MPFEPIDADQTTPVGSIDEHIASFDGSSFTMEDGRIATLSVALDGQGTYADHIPGRSVTGLPPRDHQLIEVDCTDELSAPVAWTLDLDGETSTGLGELETHLGGASLEGDGIRALVFDGMIHSLTFTAP